MVKKEQPQKEFYVLPILTILLLTGGMFFYNWAEGWSYLDSLYFSVISLTTIGYGDLAPITNIGKVFTMVYILIGIGIIFSFINAILKKRVEKRFIEIGKKLGFRK